MTFLAEHSPQKPMAELVDSVICLSAKHLTLKEQLPAYIVLDSQQDGR